MTNTIFRVVLIFNFSLSEPRAGPRGAKKAGSLRPIPGFSLQKERTPRCSSKIFKPIRINIAPPRISAPFLKRRPMRLPIRTPKIQTANVTQPITEIAAQLGTLFDGATEEELDAKEASLREQQWKNKAITELYYPGSVFKTVTCASALEEEVVSLNSTFHCAAYEMVAGTKIKCWSSYGHGTLTLQQAVTKSCNPSFIQIGQLLLSCHPGQLPFFLRLIQHRCQDQFFSGTGQCHVKHTQFLRQIVLLHFR